MLWAIGDVHGCYDELVELIDKIKLQDSNPFFVFVGDLVDRGPKSAEVMKLVRKMTKAGNTTFVIGNHDEKLYRHLQKVNNFGTSNIVVRPEWTQEVLDEGTRFFTEVPLLLSLRVAVEGRRYTIVHGGVPMTPLFDLVHTYEGANKNDKVVMRVRTVRPSAPHKLMVMLSEEKPGDVHWTEVYDGRYNEVIYGHSAYQGYAKLLPYSTGIDLGCVFGYKLAAFCLNNRDILTVDAHQEYAKYGEID